MRSRIIKFYKDLSIKKKLLLAFYIQIIVPMIFMGYLSYRNSERTIKNMSMNYAQDILQMIELRFEDYVDNLNIISQDLLYDKSIYKVLAQGDTNNPLAVYETENEITNTMKKIVLSRPEIQSIAIVNNKGKFYYADDNSSSSSIRSILPYMQVLEKARLYDGKTTWFMDSEDGIVRNIYLARVIYHQDDFQEIGLQVILVNKDFIDTVYKGLTKSMQNIVILSDQYELIATRNKEEHFIPNWSSFGMLENERDSRIDNEISALVSYTTIISTGWKVITYVPLNELFRDAYSLRQISFCCVH